jgi:chromosome segregation ATPase
MTTEPVVCDCDNPMRIRGSECPLHGRSCVEVKRLEARAVAAERERDDFRAMYQSAEGEFKEVIARAEAAERRVRTLREEAEGTHDLLAHLRDERHRLEQRVAELERINEFDIRVANAELREELVEIHGLASMYLWRANAAEAERDALRRTLKQIAGLGIGNSLEMRDVAESALAASVTTGKNEELPSDLKVVLEDAGVTIPRDTDVWELIGKWQKAKAATESSAASVSKEEARDA